MVVLCLFSVHKHANVLRVFIPDDRLAVVRVVDGNGQGVIEPRPGHWCQVIIAQSTIAAPLTDLGPLFGNQADQATTGQIADKFCRIKEFIIASR